MNKIISQFRSVIEGVESNFHFDAGCPVATAKEAILECLKWLGQIEDAAKASQAQAEADKENQIPPQATGVTDVKPAE